VAGRGVEQVLAVLRVQHRIRSAAAVARREPRVHVAAEAGGVHEQLAGDRRLGGAGIRFPGACHRATVTMSVSPARRAAYQVVLRVFEQDAYADRAFATAAAGLDARDRALAQQIAYGT